jgi:P-47 protein
LARVEVQMQFIPHDPANANAATCPHRLMIRSVPLDRSLPVANVIDLELAAGAPAPGIVFTAMIKLALTQWLCANLAQFAHVFATVNISRIATDDAFHWLKPTYATYVFLARPEPDDSVFAILCRTGNRSPDDLIEQITPNAIPPGARAAFLLSPTRMLSDMMAPSLPQVLSGLERKDIKVDEPRNRLNVSRHVKLPTVKDKDGRVLHPLLEKLQVELRDRELIMTSTISTPVSPGIESVGESQCFYHIGLVTKPDGSRTLGYRESRSPIKRDYTREGTGVKILQWMLLIGTLFVGIAMIWNGVGVGLIVAAVVMGAGTITLKAIEAVHNDDAPAIDLFVNAATDSITWANGSSFRLTSAELNGALQIGGEFTGEARKL